MPDVIDWLLAGDPAIRWQVQRDLLRAKPAQYLAERKQVACAGWGRQLLAKQDADGKWGGGLYSPKWISTTYTLLLLRDLGLQNDDPQAQRALENFFVRGLERDGGINWFKSYDRSETCVNGMILSLLSYFRSPDARVRNVAAFLLGEQMHDGGWNCERARGATHASFHTTIIVLEGLRDYAESLPVRSRTLSAAAKRGQEFLLRHSLYRSHHTGAVVDPEMTRMRFPPRWHYDILRALDYLRSVGAARDKRMADAVKLVQDKQRPDGRWLLNSPWSGRVFFALEVPAQPSRWNTLRALRVLEWWKDQ